MTLKFGTSGVRGLATEFTPTACEAWTRAFLDCCRSLKLPLNEVAVAGDLRDSTPRIRQEIWRSLQAQGVKPLDLGVVPTPALAVVCGQRNCAGIMITGSHIPADRNGLKFYLPEREILKDDEQVISAAYRESAVTPAPAGASVAHCDAAESFRRRYLSVFGEGSLSGMKVVLYEHSSVARDLLAQVLEAMGAEIVSADRSEVFQAVDTEAVQNVGRLGEFLKRSGAAALVSTDGDGDRPLVLDDRGELVPGDLLGLFTARHLGVEEIVCTVSCNTALELSNAFRKVHRTKIGSPFVLAKLMELSAQGVKASAFEANGGFLLGPGLGLDPLLTRDSFLPIVVTLVLAKRAGGKLSSLLAALPPRFTQSDLIREIPVEVSAAFLESVGGGLEKGGPADPVRDFGPLATVDRTDGLRLCFRSGDILHFRPSGNAPEFRIYVEGDSPRRAVELVARARAWVLVRLKA